MVHSLICINVKKINLVGITYYIGGLVSLPTYVTRAFYNLAVYVDSVCEYSIEGNFKNSDPGRMFTTSIRLIINYN